MDDVGGLGPAALVVNTGARRGAEAFHTAQAALRRYGVEVGVARAVDPSAVRDVVEEVAMSGHRLVVVGGGDGTISCAAGVLADLPHEDRAVLGVLPLGTANDFARTIEMPKGVEAACQSLATGKIVDIDVGRANGQAFLNVASLGLSVGVTQALTPTLKRRLGPAAYPVASVIAYRRHRPFRAWLEFPEGDVELDDLLQVGVGNGRHYGGGATVAPDAGIDDHSLDVFAIEKGMIRDHVSIVRLLRSGKFVQHEKVRHFRTTSVRVVTDGPQPVNVDGEISTSTPGSFSVRPNAIEVAVPRDVTGLRRDLE
jgi:diacylglycerol kinase (ATP)